MQQRARADNLTVFCLKKQIQDISFLYISVLLYIDNAFPHNIICQSRVMPCGSTATLAMLWQNSWSITGQRHEKLMSVCLIYYRKYWTMYSNEHETESMISITNRDIGRFHTRGRTNRLDGQILSDKQIVYVQMGWTNFLTNKSSDICLSGKMIFPRRFARWVEQVNGSTT